MTTKIMFDEFVKPKPTFIGDLTQVEFGFYMSGAFELADTKNFNISLKSGFLKVTLRASFSTRNFKEKTCTIMHELRPCLIVH